MPKIDIDRVLQMEKREEFKNNLPQTAGNKGIDDLTNPLDPSSSVFSASNINSTNPLDQKIDQHVNDSKLEE